MWADSSLALCTPVRRGLCRRCRTTAVRGAPPTSGSVEVGRDSSPHRSDSGHYGVCGANFVTASEDRQIFTTSMHAHCVGRTRRSLGCDVGPLQPFMRSRRPPDGRSVREQGVGRTKTYRPSSVRSALHRSGEERPISSRTCHTCPSSAAASAEDVRLVEAAPRAMEPTVRSTSPDGRDLDRQHLVEAEPAGGQRAGLVAADHVDDAHRLYGVDLLDQRAPSGALGRADAAGQLMARSKGNRPQHSADTANTTEWAPTPPSRPLPRRLLCRAASLLRGAARPRTVMTACQPGSCCWPSRARSRGGGNRLPFDPGTAMATKNSPGIDTPAGRRHHPGTGRPVPRPPRGGIPVPGHLGRWRNDPTSSSWSPHPTGRPAAVRSLLSARRG